MSDKRIVKILCWILLAGLVLVISACSPRENVIENRRPNFIIILSDDQGFRTMEYMPVLQTELVQKGINFTQGYATTPLCCPSRASIYSGQFAHNHGVLDNRLPLGGATRFDDTSTLAGWLHQAGYQTGLFGKYLNEYNNLQPAGYIPPGWDQWYVFFNGTRPHRFYLDYNLVENGKIVHHGTAQEEFSTDLLARRAVDFIKSSKDQPFFLVYAPYAPHQPYEFASRHSKLFRDDQEIFNILPPNFNEQDFSDKPEWLKSIPPIDEEVAVSILQRTLRSIQSVDDSIAKIVKAVEYIHQRENTVIIYLSDNGLTYGEHRLTGQKNCQFEECIRVPFVLSYPAIVKEPWEDDHIVSNIDLAPTLAELAGIKIPDSVDGASLVPLLAGAESQWRDAIMFEHWRLIEGFGSQIPDFTGIRTAQWKYVEYNTGEVELYNLELDPYEEENLASDESYANIMADLAAQLESLRQSTGFDPGLRERLIKEASPDPTPSENDLPEE